VAHNGQALEGLISFRERR